MYGARIPVRARCRGNHTWHLRGDWLRQFACPLTRGYGIIRFDRQLPICAVEHDRLPQRVFYATCEQLQRAGAAAQQERYDT